MSVERQPPWITHRDLAGLKSTPRPFSRPGWLFETKYDGFRVLAGYSEGKAILISRNGTNLLPSFPEIGRQLKSFDALAPFFLDGELVIFDDDTTRPGTDRNTLFNRLRRRLALRRPINVEHTARTERATVAAFDMLVLEGEDKRQLPLIERKKTLIDLIDITDHIFAVGFAGDGEWLYSMAERDGDEGIVAKMAKSKYHSGYDSGWLKVKTAAGRATEAERSKAWDGR